jgi:hypothetical protein
VRKFSLDTRSLRYYRFSDQEDQGAFGGRRSLESTPAENGDRLDSRKEKEEVSPPSNESGKQRRIFFETRSLAEVYAKQGHISMALEIYRRVQKRNPSDQQIEERICELEARRFPKRAIRTKEQEE